ncbi:LOW QUALITY PROTEIN: uncharacterized protein LOC110226661 [Arabidopsis lyrata subsp. lyrata]|uniref:LOW QUALITY PROTEIN: uncharacterized protein LOC110226661 n=1 Tax=Arabidopsis lyrata subsp. lyrata TaxID=81972 RepID=UPI000A29A591|nr:LOW QUALITY PROTEIN: uncharacterized protein LOC110226661 [Arabidopsis lyrata subsp. lyrata]|eukprot:XP_020874673.1 LOW QUALITY PROTEIN: uncharacterized protein LOC110226661 [Arabidopsis lyrata subsp. lyrata]
MQNNYSCLSISKYCSTQPNAQYGSVMISRLVYMFLLKYVERQKSLIYHSIHCLNPQSHTPKLLALPTRNELSYSAMDSHCYSEQDIESTQFPKMATN